MPDAHHVAMALIEESQWYEVTPLPAGEYEIVVKQENAARLDRFVELRARSRIGSDSDPQTYRSTSGSCPVVLRPVADCNFTLRLEGPLFREQHQLVIETSARRQEEGADSEEMDRWNGLVILLDEMADLAHDEYGLDCLCADHPDPEVGDVDREDG